MSYKDVNVHVWIAWFCFIKYIFLSIEISTVLTKDKEVILLGYSRREVEELMKTFIKELPVTDNVYLSSNVARDWTLHCI